MQQRRRAKKTLRPTPVSAARGMLPAFRRTISRGPPVAGSRPSAAPNSDSSTPSVRNCRDSMPGFAPIAVRMLISRWRPSAAPAGDWRRCRGGRAAQTLPRRASSAWPAARFPLLHRGAGSRQAGGTWDGTCVCWEKPWRLPRLRTVRVPAARVRHWLHRGSVPARAGEARINLAGPKLEAPRHDAHDTAGCSVQFHFPMGDARIASEDALPGSEGDGCGERGLRRVVPRRQQPAHHGRHAKFPKQAAGKGRRLETHGFPASAKIDSAGGSGIQRGPRFQVAPRFQKFRRSPEPPQTAVGECGELRITGGPGAAGRDREGGAEPRR